VIVLTSRAPGHQLLEHRLVVPSFFSFERCSNLPLLSFRSSPDFLVLPPSDLSPSLVDPRIPYAGGVLGSAEQTGHPGRFSLAGFSLPLIL